MQVRFFFKTPDAIDCSISQHFNLANENDIEQADNVRECLKTWVKWEEAVILVFDTDKKTLTVERCVEINEDEKGD